MKSYNSRELIKILKRNGWIQKSSRGSHIFFINPNNPELGKVSIPSPRDSYPKKTLESIQKQTGIKL